MKSSQTSTLANHVRTCPNITDPAIKNRAASDWQRSSPRKRPRTLSNSSFTSQPAPFTPNPVHGYHSVPSMHYHPTLIPPSLSSPSPSIQLSPGLDPFLTPALPDTEVGPSDSVSAISSQSGHSRHLAAYSPYPSSSVSARTGSSRGGSKPLSKRQSSSFRFDPVPVWDERRRKAYERRMIRFTASANLPFSWIEDIEWNGIVEEFIPGAPYISRKVLSTRILDDAVKELRGVTRHLVHGRSATLQADGWTGTNNHHLVAFMITSNKQVCKHIQICSRLWFC